MDTYGWLLDPKRCIECRACEAACKQWNQVETGSNIRLRLVRISETGKFPSVRVQALSLACNHCENPVCVKACPVKALYRRPDGIVMVDRGKCLGCGECALWCPYDAPQVNFAKTERKMQKCTMCADRIDQKLQPACATVCPTGALQWGKWADIQETGSAEVEGFRSSPYTKPHIRFKPAVWSAS